MRRATLLLVCLAAVACPAPGNVTVTPQIHVDPRAARRLDLLATPAASSGAPAIPPARVHVMKPGEQLGGPNAVGRPGDLVLENDEVAFVIDQLGSSAGFAETGGNLVDAADARERKDELGQMFSYFGTFPRQGVYETLTSGTGDDGSAWVEVRGHELYEAKLAVTTRYTLHAPDRALLVETTLENTGDAPVALPSVGDAVQWGGAEKIAPGERPGFKGPYSGPYVGGVGRFTSYAITSTEGGIEAVSGSSWTDTAQRKGVTLAPHARTEYARVFVVGERPDTSSLVAELAMAAGQKVGELEARPSSGLGTGETLTLVPEGSSERLSLARPYRAYLPNGRYTVLAVGEKPVGPIEVRAGTAQAVDVPIAPRASLSLACEACKVTFQGVAPTPDPDFGPAHAAGPARNQVTIGRVPVEVSLPAGRYHVTASRGPEYALDAVDVDTSRSPPLLKLDPKRVVDTSGYLACDFHQHTMLGADAPTSLRDRVVSNVAEGVEVSVASEHNVIADLEPIVREMGLDARLVSIAGDELTTDASRHPWGHANVWPMPVDAAKPRGGAPPVRDRSAKDVMDSLRKSLPGDWVFQVNHPRTGITGYFDQLGFDRARGAGTDPGYDGGFDALEVWNGRNVQSRQRVIDDWCALLRTGHPVTATADTDTHGVVGQEAGYPRTYVRVDDDGHLDSWDAARTADLVRGVKVRRDVVLTNGPMLRVTANGVPVGGVAEGKRVTVKVHVECAPWVDVDTVRLLHAQTQGGERAPEQKRSVRLAPLPSGALAADVRFTVATPSDDALYVVASGSKPLTPVLGGDAAEILPWAMTGALWVDADGDGKSLGR